MHAKSLQSCLTLCNPPGSSVHGILQARILEWIAMPSFQGIFLAQGSRPTCISYISCIGRRAFCHYCHLRSSIKYWIGQKVHSGFSVSKINLNKLFHQWIYSSRFAKRKKKILILCEVPMYKSICVWEFLKQALLSNKVT